MTLKYGLVIPLNDTRTAVDLACEAEAAGWDGFFVGEAIWSIDPWVTLAAAAVRTTRIRLGTLLTPMPLTGSRPDAMETLFNLTSEQLLERLRQGPPRLA